MILVPLGTHVEGDGVGFAVFSSVGFAVFSSVADAVEVCLFDEQNRETRRQLDPDEGYIWRGHLQGIGHGTRYGFRVHGPWDPQYGLRCNPAKLLLDPYARAIAGGVRWDAAVQGDNPADSAPYVPRSVVCASEYDWSGDRRPETSLQDSIIYELHVRGSPSCTPTSPPSCAEPIGAWRIPR